MPWNVPFQNKADTEAWSPSLLGLSMLFGIVCYVCILTLDSIPTYDNILTPETGQRSHSIAVCHTIRSQFYPNIQPYQTALRWIWYSGIYLANVVVVHKIEFAIIGLMFKADVWQHDQHIEIARDLEGSGHKVITILLLNLHINVYEFHAGTLSRSSLFCPKFGKSKYGTRVRSVTLTPIHSV